MRKDLGPSLKAVVGRAGRLIRWPRLITPWFRARRRARADLRWAIATIRSARAGKGAAEPRAIAKDTARLVKLGRVADADALLELAEQQGGDVWAVLRARRRLRGYVGTAAPDIIACAAQAMGADGGQGEQNPIVVRTQRVASGYGPGVDVVVRHHLADGRSMIRKTLRGPAPIEVLAYQSGLVDGRDRIWRAPQLYSLEKEGTRTWHLFLEDLGEISRLESPHEVVTAARALGEFNAAHLGEQTLATRFPWLVPPPPTHSTFSQPGYARRRLMGVVDDTIVTRVRRTLAVLHAHRGTLSKLYSALPVTVCHGDANTANMAIRDGVLVLIDWATCRLAPVGTDLAYLLGLSNRAVLDQPSLVRECLDAYRQGMAAVARPAPTEQEIELGYRHRCVSHSFRRLLNRLPAMPVAGEYDPQRDAPLAPDPQQTRLEAHLTRLCDESDALLSHAEGDAGPDLTTSTV